jgi:hypothetical protein
MAILPRHGQSMRGDQGQPTVTALRAVFTLIGVGALVLGLVGLEQYLGDQPAASRHPLNLLYGTLQLFVLGSDPLQNATNFPPALQIARFAAPAVTLFAVTEACRLLLASELRRLRARRSHGHVVVCGDTSVARTLAERLHAAGEHVVVVRTQPIGALELRRRTLLGVNGNPRDPDVLRGAGAGRSAVIYACEDDSAKNVAIATTAASLVAQHGGDTAVYAQIHDPERALALQARRLGVANSGGLRLDFFNLDQLAVHVLLAQQPLSPRDGRAPRLLVVGDSPFARALLVELSRHWRLRGGGTRSRLAVDFVAPDAAQVLGDLERRHVTLGQSCEITAYAGELGALLAAHSGALYHRAFICDPDEEAGLQIALTGYDLWHRVTGAVVVPVDRLSGLADAFTVNLPQPLLDQLDGRLQLFPKVSAGCDPMLIAEDLSERLARLIHERFVLSCLARGEKLGSSPALVDWADLDAERRRANRSQASDIGPKLHMLGCAIVPRSQVEETFRFEPGEVEMLAVVEQRRWMTVAATDGWSYGRRRDDAKRENPYLVDWSELAADGREKCRAAIHDIPLILADAGFQVLRLTKTGHDRELRPV